LFPLLATGGSPGVIQRRGVGRRNGEIPNAATESGVPGVSFTPFMFFMVKCICLSSVRSASSVVKLYWLFFVLFVWFVVNIFLLRQCRAKPFVVVVNLQLLDVD